MTECSTCETLKKEIQKLQNEVKQIKEDRETYFEIFSMSPDLICLADIETSKFLKVNPAFTRLLGYTEKQLISSSFLDFIHPDDVKPTTEIINENLKQGKKVLNFTNRYRCSDGTYRWLEWLAHPMAERGITFASAHDITSRKQLETSLRENEVFITTVMDSLPIGIAVNSVDPSVNFNYMNDNFTRFYRTTKKALSDQDGFWSAVYEDALFREIMKKQVLDDCATGDPAKMVWDDVPIARKGEETTYICARNTPIPDKGLMVSTVWDVTERIKTEEALKETKRLLEDTQAIAKLGGWEYDIESKRLIWTDEVFRIHGLEKIRNPVAVEDAMAFYGGRNRRLIEKSFQLAADKNEPYDLEVELTRADGKSIWVRTMGQPVLENGKVVRIVGNILDITEIKLSQKSLIESEARFRVLHNASFGGIAIHDEGLILECNEGLSKITGYSENELCGMNVLLLLAEESRKTVLENIQSGNEKPYEAIGLRKNGEEYPLRLEGRNIPYKGKRVRVVEFRDITENKQVEAEREQLLVKLTQAQKMEAIGTLAGGIAHDFNNILSVVLGYAELLKEDFSSEEHGKKELNQIIMAGNRAKDLVSQILAFSRVDKEELRPIRPHLVIKEALKMLRASIPTTIKIEQNVQNCGSIIGDTTQLHQIMMNLCTNAYHAMRESGGVLSVMLELIVLDKNDSTFFSLALPPGHYLKLEISDTGHGIGTTTQRKIFDPYFTTKRKGEGTGLGLAVVHGIVKNFGGQISLYSEPGRGTTFRIYFPQIELETETKMSESLQMLPVGDENILVVDDEEVIAEMEKQMLESLGYKVSIFTSSLEALLAFRNQPGEFDAVITDMTMPDMTGIELMQLIRNIRPNIPIILCSGFSEQINKDKAAKMGIQKYLMKPVQRKDFAFAMREILDNFR
jgi:PAS domain S-box-containing protein